ncbi:MAG TPA: CusA/CzcA family heavy metal efflux RND transporter [Bacteroidales bacterium]|nr:CusA/CzcA family heavy metal efflux RND transporter [Bacteroidales bacterium]
MIERIIDFSIKNKLVVALFTLVLIIWGIFSLTRLPIDAVPDITNNQVQIISTAPALAVQEVEKFITAPLEVSVANIPGITELRSISRFGLSVVTVVFDDDVDLFRARTLVSESIKEAEEQIPEGLTTPEMAPVSTGLGEIFQYTLAVDNAHKEKYTAMDLRTIQDWIVRREMLGTPGVAEVNSYGGLLKQYEVAINPEKLRSMNLTLSDILDALEKNNENTGGAYIDKKPSAFFIRGIGLISSLEDIGKIVVTVKANGIPVLIRDVATVQLGNATRYGALVCDTIGEGVGGVIMMLKGSNAREVINNVKQRMEVIKSSLPEGVTIEPYLDRTHLVNRAIGTVSRNLLEGGLIVVLVLVLLLGNFRAGLIVASVIPLSMLFAISMMRIFGVSGNLMSLGAIDFGLIVDGAVIIVESIAHRIFKSNRQSLEDSRLTQQQMDAEVSASSKRMMSSATFGQIIILIVYIPILALIGIEGKMFRPMAQVVSFAILGAVILSLTYVPVASSLFLSKNTYHKPNLSDRINQFFHRIFNHAFVFAIRRKTFVLTVSLILFLSSILVFMRLGGEFIPQLNEGDLAAGVITLQGGSLSNTVEIVEKANKILMSNFPEVVHAMCKVGAGEIPTDPTPLETGDYIITLKDQDEWVSAKTREELISKMEEKLSVLAGVKFEFQQPIQMRFNELMTGAKQDVAIKIFGDNLDVLAENGAKVNALIRNIDGIEDVDVEKVTGLPQIQIEYNRDKLAGYGINISEINKLLKTAFAGTTAGVVFEEENRFDLVVRFGQEYREDIENVRNLFIPLPAGGQISLDQIADVRIKGGPAQVSRENTKRRITIGFNVRGRDVQSVIKEVQSTISANLNLPAGYYITYGGQFENLVAASQRLSLAVPIALLLIFVLLFFTFRSLKESLLIFSAVPLSAIGGVFALWMRDMNFSISAGVGFIALFGVSVLNGIVLIAEFNRLEKEERISDITERVLKGLRTRLRPVLMTASVASLGFLPMAIATSAGAEVQKPLATVVIGGLFTSTLLTLLVLPVLYILFSSQKKIFLSFKPKVKYTRPICLVIAGTICLTGANAQTLTLDDAIKMANDSNLHIQSAIQQVRLQKALKGASWDINKTNVGAEYGQMNSSAKDNSFSISQTIAFPSVYINQNRLANAQVKSSETSEQMIRNDIVSQVRKQWWQLSYLYSTLRLLQYQDSLFIGVVKAAKLRLNAGETDRLEQLNAEAQSMEIKNQLNQVLSDIGISKNKLKKLLNIKQDIRIADTVLIKLASPIDVEVNRSPLLESQKQQIAISQIETRVEKAKLMPDLTIGYFNQSIIGTQEVNGLIRNYTSSDRFTGIQAGIAIPLWFHSQASKIKASRIKQQIALNDAANVELELRGELDNLLKEHEKYKKSLLYYETSAIPQAEIIIEQANRSYLAGDLDYIDYIQSLSRAITIKHNYLDNLMQYNQTIIEIEYLTGKN